MIAFYAREILQHTRTRREKKEIRKEILRDKIDRVIVIRGINCTACVINPVMIFGSGSIET